MKSAPIPLPRYSKLTQQHRLNWFDSFDLREHYKIKDAFIIQNISPYIVIALVTWLAVGYFVFIDPTQPLVLTTLISAGIAAIVSVVVATFFWIWYRRKIEFTVDGLRLNNTRGIIKKYTGSIVIRAHNMFYIYQRPIDLPFGIWNFQMYGSNQLKPEHAHFPGLSREDAYDIFRFFTNEVSQQVTVAEPKFGDVE